MTENINRLEGGSCAGSPSNSAEVPTLVGFYVTVDGPRRLIAKGNGAVHVAAISHHYATVIPNAKLAVPPERPRVPQTWFSEQIRRFLAL